MDWRTPELQKEGIWSTAQEFRVLYRDSKEQLLARMPKPRGNEVEISAFVDASHAANKKTRRSHTGYLIFVNKAPVMWYSKRQNTIEASTFGSEYIALKECVEAIIHLRFKLRMFGIPLMGQKEGEIKPANVFCDNESVVKNSSNVESALNKKHNSIAYHFVRWNVAAGVVQLSWIQGENNLADLFTKRLGKDRREYLLDEFTY